MTVTVPPPAGRDSERRRRSRSALAAVIWDESGRRRLPGEDELVTALDACAGEDVWWVCEASSAGPVYLLPTVEWTQALAARLDELEVKSVLEVAAGDGFLSRCLAAARPNLTVSATDDGSWARPAARMNAADRTLAGDIVFAGIRAEPQVTRMRGVAAVDAFRPDLVLVSWAPPGQLVDRIIRAHSKWVLDISVDGDVCGNGMRTWRFRKEFWDGPVEDRALCRLDGKPKRERKTRVTLYYGGDHAEHGLE